MVNRWTLNTDTCVVRPATKPWFGRWETGELLNVPIPLANGQTVGDAVGRAEGYGSTVLQFLRDANGVPEFS